MKQPEEVRKERILSFSQLTAPLERITTGTEKREKGQEERRTTVAEYKVTNESTILSLPSPFALLLDSSSVTSLVDRAYERVERRVSQSDTNE